MAKYSRANAFNDDTNSRFRYFKIHIKVGLEQFIFFYFYHDVLFNINFEDNIFLNFIFKDVLCVKLQQKLLQYTVNQWPYPNVQMVGVSCGLDTVLLWLVAQKIHFFINKSNIETDRYLPIEVFLLIVFNNIYNPNYNHHHDKLLIKIEFSIIM